MRTGTGRGGLALDGLGKARTLGLAAVGVVAAGCVATGGQPPTEAVSDLRCAWPVGGPWLCAGGRPGPVTGLVVAAVAGAVVLAGCAFLAWWLAQRGALGTRGAIALGSAWGLPLLAGPVVLSADVFSYAAQGQLLVRGLNPYRLGTAALGPGALLSTVDPRWHGTPCPYGPLGLAIERAAALLGGGDPRPAAVALRLMAVVGVVVSGGVALRLSQRAGRPAVAVVCLANAVVLMHLVGGAHLEAVMLPLMLGGLLAGAAGRPVLGLALATAGGAVKAPALLAVAALVAADLLGAARSARGPTDRTDRTDQSRRLLLVAGRDLATVAVTGGLLTLLVPDGTGWVRALGTPGLARTYDAPTSGLAVAAGAVARAVGARVDTDLVLQLARAAGWLTLVVVVAALLVTAGRRPPAATTGWALLALALLGPVFYAWYLTWSLFCLAPVVGARGRGWLMVASGAVALTSLPSLAGRLPVAAQAGLAAAPALALLAAAVLVARRPSAGHSSHAGGRAVRPAGAGPGAGRGKKPHADQYQL